MRRAKNADVPHICLGVAQLVARYLGVVEAAGSNPVTQTSVSVHKGAHIFYICYEHVDDPVLLEWDRYFCFIVEFERGRVILSCAAIS